MNFECLWNVGWALPDLTGSQVDTGKRGKEALWEAMAGTGKGDRPK